MSKTSDYLPLGQYLQKQETANRDCIILTFSEIENILRRKLLPTARKNKTWWSNSKTEPFRQCSSWLNYGWEKEQVDLKAEKVEFRKMN